MFELMYTFEPA